MSGDPPPFRVLLVDDEPRILDLLKLVLERHGRSDVRLEVTTATDAAQALRAMRERPADLVLTDYRMPGPSGAELLARVREAWPSAARGLMTGYHELAEGDDVERADAHFTLAKPFDVERVKESVLAQLGSKARSR